MNTYTTLRSRPGFTLMELMITLMLIALLAALALPTVMTLFNSGAEEQAVNILTAQINAARSLAIRKNTYAGVHVQLADKALDIPFDTNDPRERKYVCYSAVVWADPSAASQAAGDQIKFRIAPNYQPIRMPRTIAFGVVAAPFVNPDEEKEPYTTALLTHRFDASDMSGPDYIREFTTFTIVFSPSGQILNRLPTGDLEFAEIKPEESGGPEVDPFIDDDDPKTEASLWNRDWAEQYQTDYNTGDDDTKLAQNRSRRLARTVVVFDVVYLMQMPRSYLTADSKTVYPRADHMNATGGYLAINPHTGQLLPRE